MDRGENTDSRELGQALREDCGYLRMELDRTLSAFDTRFSASVISNQSDGEAFATAVNSILKRWNKTLRPLLLNLQIEILKVEDQVAEWLRTKTVHDRV